ncbi:MAG: Dehydrogenase with different specificity [Frankiales bacterium]|nr:Dehydrogenase with different specificity [Frankiales bacterium]
MVNNGTVVVTGAAAGIGREVVARFVAGGWRVIALDRDGQKLTSEWGENPAVSGFEVDITDETALKEAMAASGADVIDACINVAGIYPPSSFREFTVEQFQLHFSINVLGTLLTTRAALPYLEKSTEAVVVNFASIAAYTSGAERFLYKASKAAVVSLTRTLATDLAPGIRVVGISPGPVMTANSAGGAGNDEFRNTVPLKRLAEPAEFADWVWALAGDTPLSFITGETIVISGGAYMA